MFIPDNKHFEEILASLTFDCPKIDSDHKCLVIVPEIKERQGEKSFRSEPISLWYQDSGPIKLEAVLQRIRKGLKTKGDLSTPAMAGVFLGILALDANRGTPCVTRLNKLISMIYLADTSQFWIAAISPPSESHTFHLGRFTVGLLNRQRLEYRCKKVDCDFFERNPNIFLNQFAIEGAPIPVQVLDWSNLVYDSSPHLYIQLMALSKYYFQLKTMELYQSFPMEFLAAQQVFVAAGAPLIDTSQPLVWSQSHFIAIFQNVGPSKKGFFCPLGSAPGLDFAEADIRFPRIAQELEKSYGFTSLGSSEIHQTLGTYCRFIVKARDHDIRGRKDEAFLHYVIALDLLLGEKDFSTQKIPKRTAVLTSRVLGQSFSEMVKRLYEIYAIRSLYVHKGKEPSDVDLETIKPIIHEVLFCLLRLQALESNREENFLSRWLRELDFLTAAEDAGKLIRDEELAECGISLKPKENVS